MRKWMPDRAKMEKSGFLTILCVFGMFILLLGGTQNAASLPYRLQRVLLHSAQRMFLPGTLYEDSEIKKPAATWITEQVFFLVPVGRISGITQYL